MLSGAICLLRLTDASVSSVGTAWAPGAESAPNVGLLFNGVNHWDAFTLDIRAYAVVVELFDMNWVTVQRR